MQPHFEGLQLIGDGDSLDYVTVTAGQVREVFGGSAGNPDTNPNPLVKISRVVDLTTAQVTGDGSSQASTFAAYSSAPSDAQVQPVGLFGYAETLATGGNADATGIYGVGIAKNASARIGIGGFFLGSNRSSAAGAQNRMSGIQVAAENRTGLGDAVVNATGFSGGALWVTTGNSFDKVATAIEIANSGIAGHGAKSGLFDVGIHFSGQVNNGLTGAIDSASIRDDANGSYSYLINGLHALAAMAVASGSGPVLVGGLTQIGGAGTLLEVQGGASATPLVLIGSTTAHSYSLQVRNSSGVAELGIAGAAGSFFAATAAGDFVIRPTTASKRIIIGASSPVVSVTNAGGLGFFGVAEATQQAGGAKTAAATYGTNEQTMLQTVYNMGRTFGLLS